MVAPMVIRPVQMACHIHDRGWIISEHRQDGKHLYTSPERPFMDGVDLDTAYALQRSQEDKMGDKIPRDVAMQQINDSKDSKKNG